MFLSDSEYDVEFKTGSEENAGTDANVYFQMMGEEGESQEIELKNKGNGYFNRGQLDRFRIRAKDVGRVSHYPGIGVTHLGVCGAKGYGFQPTWSEIGYRFWSRIGYGVCTVVLNIGCVYLEGDNSSSLSIRLHTNDLHNTLNIDLN